MAGGVDRGRDSKSSLASAIQSLNPSSFDTSLTRFPNVILSGGVWIHREDSERSEEDERFRRGSSQCLLFISSRPTDTPSERGRTSMISSLSVSRPSQYQ
jgi:hypothetical protein